MAAPAWTVMAVMVWATTSWRLALPAGDAPRRPAPSPRPPSPRRPSGSERASGPQRTPGVDGIAEQGDEEQDRAAHGHVEDALPLRAHPVDEGCPEEPERDAARDPPTSCSPPSRRWRPPPARAVRRPRGSRVRGRSWPRRTRPGRRRPGRRRRSTNGALASRRSDTATAPGSGPFLPAPGEERDRRRHHGRSDRTVEREPAAHPEQPLMPSGHRPSGAAPRAA